MTIERVRRRYDILDGFACDLDQVLEADHSWSGLTMERIAGENLLIFDSCYMAADGEFYKTDADAVGTMPSEAIALSALSANDPGIFLFIGVIRDDTWGWTPGGLLYPEDATAGTAGELSHVQPAGVGDQVQVVGFALTADIIFYNPSYDIVERA